MSLLQYPEYQESGSEWLGRIPEHWAVTPLKWALKNIESGTSVNAVDLPREMDAFGILKTSCVYKGWFDWTENKTVLEEDLDRVSCPLKTSTLIVSRMNTPDLVGATGLVDYAPAGIFLPDRLWQVSFADKHSPRFFHYFTKSQEYRGQIKLVCSGTSSSMQNLGQDDFRGIVSAVPPESEQIQIARFLDHETAKIDALISEQERLIELLQEKRQAVISHAVTKGLDSDVPMKDSGVEWLGEVPAHWQVVRMRFLCRITTGDKDTQDSEPEGKYPFFVRSETIERSDTYSFDGEGVFTSGDGAGVGKIYHHFEGKCAIHQRVYLFHHFSDVSGRFFYQYIKSKLKPVVLAQSAKSTVDSLRLPMLQNFWMTCPPQVEQEKICTNISKFEVEASSLLQQSKMSIDLLRERRSALISAAVTGKIDVRNWQPPADESVFDEEVRQAGVESTA